MPRTPDDVALAGVADGKVLIVGKKACRALSLSKGETRGVCDTGLPSGQAALAAGRLFLPPAGGGGLPGKPEVCVLDLAARQGRGALALAHGEGAGHPGVRPGRGAVADEHRDHGLPGSGAHEVSRLLENLCCGGSSSPSSVRCASTVRWGRRRLPHRTGEPPPSGGGVSLGERCSSPPPDGGGSPTLSSMFYVEHPLPPSILPHLTVGLTRRAPRRLAAKPRTHIRNDNGAGPLVWRGPAPFR